MHYLRLVHDSRFFYEILIFFEVIPVLRVLHDGTPSGSLNLSSNSHHVYLSLIVILILSEDDFFCKIVHETVCVFAFVY